MPNPAQQLARQGRKLAKKAATTGFHVARAGAERALDKAFGDGDAERRGPQRESAAEQQPTPSPAPPRTPAPEPPTASEAVEAERAEARAWRPADTEPSPPDPLLEHVEEEVTLAAESADPGAEEGAGPEVAVSEPWAGYDRMRARDVVERVSAADPDTAAAVRLYEAGNKRRKTVLDAAARAGRG